MSGTCRLTVETVAQEGGTATLSTVGYIPDTTGVVSKGPGVPTPLVAALASLTGCLSIVIPLTAMHMGFSLDRLSFFAEGRFDPDDLKGLPGVSRRFWSVDLEIRLETPESSQHIEDLAQFVEDRCPVHGLLRLAGIGVATTWTRVEVTGPSRVARAAGRELMLD